MGGRAAFVDVENALDPIWIEKTGIDINNLIVSQPDCGENALDIAEMYIRSGEIDLVVVDSVAGLIPKAEINGDFGDSHMGLQARLMSQGLRKLSNPVKENNCVLIFTNQM